MDISRPEQQVLHALAQGGHIEPRKDERGKITAIECYNREGWLMPHVSMALFKKLKRRKAIRSLKSGPYRITRRGLELVRPEFDNR